MDDISDDHVLCRPESEEKKPASTALTLETSTTTEVEQKSMTPCSDLSTISAVAPFNEDDTREIIRQVEYYFSDQNLPSDAHLLGLSGGDGNGPVSIKRILGFRKMKPYKPPTAVKEILRCSTVLELVDNGKSIQRRIPLTIQPTVQPTMDMAREHIEQTLAANPHLTKGMLKPTGFEEYYADTPITPDQYRRDRELYHNETSFETRIENAIRSYKLKRKMHQSTAKVFNLYMHFGGIDTSPNAFTGGVDADELADMDKEELAFLRCPYTVAEHIIVHDEMFKVDFKKVAMSFLSTEFPMFFRADSHEDITNVCNVMSNFLNYLLHHDVCPEHYKQIIDTRQALKHAEIELKQLILADKELQAPHGFQAACSMLHQLPKVDEDPWLPMRECVYTVQEAKTVFEAGLAMLGSKDQVDKSSRRWLDYDQGRASNATPLTTRSSDAQQQDVDDNEVMEQSDNTPQARMMAAGWTLVDDVLMPPSSLHSPLKVVASEEMGLEIVALRTTSQDDQSLALGVMTCRRWAVPGRELIPVDKFGQTMPDEMDFIVNQTAADACQVGMKLQAEVRQLDVGIFFFERIERTLPTFYDYLPDVKKVKTYLDSLTAIAAKSPPMAVSSNPTMIDSTAISQQVDDRPLAQEC